MPASVSIASKKRSAHQIAERMNKDTNLTSGEVESLVNFMYGQASTIHNNRLDKMKFREILIEHFEFTDSILMDQVFKTFDTDNDGFVGVEEWVRGMSIFLRGNYEEQSKFCFETYAMNSDNQITRDVMFTLLKNCWAEKGAQEMGEDDPEEGVKELIELILKKMDIDKDTKLSYEDYKDSCSKELLLLEFLGNILPDQNQVERYLNYMEYLTKNAAFYD